MAKQLNFEFEDKAYTLEFTRKSLETMEKQGFSISDAERKPMSTLPELFAGAFLANHRYVKRDVVDRIFQSMTGKSELFGKLAEMYQEPLVALMDEPEESKGNVSWTATW